MVMQLGAVVVGPLSRHDHSTIIQSSEKDCLAHDSGSDCVSSRPEPVGLGMGTSYSCQSTKQALVVVGSAPADPHRISLLQSSTGGPSR